MNAALHDIIRLLAEIVADELFAERVSAGAALPAPVSENEPPINLPILHGDNYEPTTAIQR
jgi:hypothetical protein